MTINDVLAIVFASGSIFGGGYHNIHHIYLPAGQDICFNPTACYSPDDFSTFAFCAFHSSVTFGALHVVFTVEPFQDVPGCRVHQPSPNGSRVDSQASVLSHETFETITDPDLNAWYNHVALDLFGFEIGDECQNTTFNYGTVSINHHNYEVQPEYSNKVKGCAFSTFRSE